MIPARHPWLLFITIPHLTTGLESGTCTLESCFAFKLLLFGIFCKWCHALPNVSMILIALELVFMFGLDPMKQAREVYL